MDKYYNKYIIYKKKYLDLKKNIYGGMMGHLSTSISRFIDAQENEYEVAYKEIENDRKKGHWIWYIFPTPPYYDEYGNEIGSNTNKQFAIRSIEELHNYINNTNLRNNYYNMLALVLEKLNNGIQFRNLFGRDHLKVKNSIKLFEYGSRGGIDNDLNTLCLEIMGILNLNQLTDFDVIF